MEPDTSSPDLGARLGGGNETLLGLGRALPRLGTRHRATRVPCGQRDLPSHLIAPCLGRLTRLPGGELPLLLGAKPCRERREVVVMGRRWHRRQAI